jgi:hypothetical protein
MGLFRPCVSSSGEGYPKYRYTPLQRLAALTAGPYRQGDRMILRCVFEEGRRTTTPCVTPPTWNRSEAQMARLIASRMTYRRTPWSTRVPLTRFR